MEADRKRCLKETVYINTCAEIYSFSMGIYSSDQALLLGFFSKRLEVFIICYRD